MTGYSLAVDIGGTFTDIVLRHREGRFWVDKTLTTVDDLKRGFFAAIDGVMRRADCRPAMVDEVLVHATTVVTNAVIERKGPRCALLVTEGFLDVLTIRDEARSDIFDNQLEVPQALIPRDLTYPVAERTLADGTVLREVDREALRRTARRLKREKVVSVAVCLLNAYANPHNERVVREVLAQEAPGLFVSLSSDIAPQMREYPRASTTVLNAYTVPIVKPYLDMLGDGLRQAGFRQDLLIMLSSGGVIGAQVAGENPVRMIESGPAAGALAASFYARLLGLPDLFAFDMGGTTAKACFIRNGEPLVSTSFEVDRIYRFQHGSGLPVAVPSIDLIEIGAGGGSLAGVDSLGLLTVGPQSAGSTPGPACYGRGGTLPTVTDADLALGLIDAAGFLGGEMPLDEAAARTALTEFGKVFNLYPGQLALGIHRIVGESMAAAVRAHASDRGIDWRGVPLLAFGGAGPVHACHVAELLDSRMVIYPPMASVLSAFGTLVTPVRLDLVRSAMTRLEAPDWELVDRHVAAMSQEARQALERAGTPPEEIRIAVSADFRYGGQFNELTIAVPVEALAARDTAAMRAAYEAEYERLYGVALDNLAVEAVAWRVIAQGPDLATDMSRARAGAGDSAPRQRKVHFASGPCDTPIHARTDLQPGWSSPGPLIIEERETTIVILPGWRARVDALGCIFAEREGA